MQQFNTIAQYNENYSEIYRNKILHPELKIHHKRIYEILRYATKFNSIQLPSNTPYFWYHE